jgi:hypothetical protein
MIDRRTIGCTGDLGAVGSDVRLNRSVPVIRVVLAVSQIVLVLSRTAAVFVLVIESNGDKRNDLRSRRHETRWGGRIADRVLHPVR